MKKFLIWKLDWILALLVIATLSYISIKNNNQDLISTFAGLYMGYYFRSRMPGEKDLTQ